MKLINRRRPAIEFVSQVNRSDCGHACAAMMLGAFGKSTPIFSLKLRYPVGGMGLSAKQLVDILAAESLAVKAYKATDNATDALMAAGKPLIAHYHREHFVVVSDVTDTTVSVLDPSVGPMQMSHQEFRHQWSGVFMAASAQQAIGRARADGLLDEVKLFLHSNASAWAIMVSVAMATAAIVIALPWVLVRLIPILKVGHGQGSELLVSALALLMVLFIASQWLRSRVAIAIQLACDRALTLRFIDRVLALPLRLYTEISPGDLISRVNALLGIRDFLSSRIAAVVTDLVIVFSTLAVIAYLSPSIAVIFILLSAATSALLYSARGRLKAVVAEEISQYARYYECLTETLSSMVEVKTTGRESVFARRWTARFDTHRQAVRVRGNFAALFDAMYVFQDRVIPVLTLILVFTVIPSADVPDSTKFFCYFLLLWTGPSLRSIQSFCMQLVTASINLDRIRSITGLMSVPAADAPVAASDGLASVTASALTFSYRGSGHPVIKALSLSFRGPGLYVIVGPSGGGKSTLLRLLAGLLSPDNGKVSVEVGAPGGSIAYLNQHPTLFAGTVAENIALFDEQVNPSRLAECARLACVHDDIMRLPMGYEAYVADRGADLSAGQRQRIALARLLYADPSIILLDEFTSDVDLQMESQIVANLRATGMLVIIATHRVAWIDADDVMLELGKHMDSETMQNHAIGATR